MRTLPILAIRQAPGLFARGLAWFRGFDGVDGGAAGDIAAIDQPFAVGREMLVGFERVVMACEIDEPFRLQRAGCDQRVAAERVASAGIVVGAGWKRLIYLPSLAPSPEKLRPSGDEAK